MINDLVMNGPGYPVSACIMLWLWFKVYVSRCYLQFTPVISILQYDLPGYAINGFMVAFALCTGDENLRHLSEGNRCPGT